MGFHVSISGKGSMTSDRHTFVRGAAFKGTSKSDLVSLSECFSGIQVETDFRSLLCSLNGYFAVVCERGPVLFAAVDKARSIPLFYGTVNGEFYIGDDARWVQARVCSPKRSEVAEYEFCLTGYVTGSETLYPGVKQLRAGELLVAELGYGSVKTHIEHYYDFISSEECYAPDVEELSRQFDRVLVGCFERLIRLANGRSIVVPLSGGWDSRLVVLMLTRLGYGNVIAFTYGRPGNTESQISRQVADLLDITWNFVPYTNELWKEWFWSEERVSYYAMAHNAVSIPHLQDWPAVWGLKARGIISDDSIFVPGHTGDFLSGTTGITEAFFEGEYIAPAKVADEVYKGHYALCRFGQKESSIKQVMIKRILNQMGVSSGLTPHNAVGLYKRWVWQERQAKFIVNSVRVYEFWNYGWWIPLGDSEMRDFWSRVPLDLRFGRKLYIAHIKNLTEQILGAECASRLGTDRDVNYNVLTELVKQTPFRNLARSTFCGIQRIKKRTTDYERHPLAWYGIMDEEVFRRYYFSGNGHISQYQALDILSKITLI